MIGKVYQALKGISLVKAVIAGLLAGTAYAYLAVVNDWTQFTSDWIMPFGDIFINLLKMIAVPLVLFSIITGIISLKDISKLGRMGLKTVALYLITTFFAVSLGLVLVNLINPGSQVDEQLRIEKRIEYELWVNGNENVEKLDDINLIGDPTNADLVAQVQQHMEQEDLNDWVSDKMEKHEGTKDAGPLDALREAFSSNIFRSLADSNMMQIIFFALFFGIVLALMPKSKSEPVFKLVDGLNEVFIKMVWIVMKFMPFFVFALMAGQIVKAAGSDPVKFMQLLTFYGWYGGTVIIGLAIMIFVVYPLIAKFLARVGFGKFMGGIRDAQLTAFSTSSSVATLPVTMRVLQCNIGVSKSTTSFVLPIGATVNMDGTSLYQGVAVVAMAQFHMVDLSIMQQLVIVGTATIASIGAAAVPSAGLVLMMVVLESVGLNPAWIAIIFPIDRILDMCRTVVNVTGDATVASVVAKTEGEDFEQNIRELQNEEEKELA